MEYIQMRVSNDRHYRIRYLAAKKGKSISETLGEIIDFYFSRKEEDDETLNTQESRIGE